VDLNIARQVIDAVAAELGVASATADKIYQVGPVNARRVRPHYQAAIYAQLSISFWGSLIGVKMRSRPFFTRYCSYRKIFAKRLSLLADICYE
jgi:hypothetical protein